MLIHLVHVAALANFAYALYFDIYLVKLPKSEPRHDVRNKGVLVDRQQALLPLNSIPS